MASRTFWSLTPFTAMRPDRLLSRPTIGVLTGWQYYWTATSPSYLDPLFRGIHQAVRELDCNLLLACGMGPSAASDDPIRPAWPMVAEDVDFVPVGPWNTDGLIVVNPLHSPRRSAYIQRLIARGHPVVFIATGEEGTTVAADNAQGILEALHHLVEHGHRHIAFIAGSPDDLTGDTGERLQAYREGMARFGLNCDEQAIAFGRHVYEGGYTAMHQILAAGIPFSAVLASNDESAWGAIQALREAGKRVPQDVAVIGFDDRPESAVHEPALTTVHIPLPELGYRAVEVLLDRIQAPETPPTTVRVPTRLVVRASCGCDTHPVWAVRSDQAAAPEPAQTSEAWRTHLVQEMAAALQIEDPGLPSLQVVRLCRELVDAFTCSLERGDPACFRAALERILERTASVSGNLHGWQAAIRVLRGPQALWAAIGPNLDPELADHMLDAALMTIAQAAHLQHRRFLVDRRRIDDRLGILTARLLTALDEDHVYQILARHLPEMDVTHGWIALFDPAGKDQDPVARCRVRDLLRPNVPIMHIESRRFPGQIWNTPERPYHLALIPLVSSQVGKGFAAFDVTQLNLYGSIVQQVSAALNSAQLYREATEGRRLAEEANRLKSRFLSTVSHELRTPLHLILGMSKLLLEETEEPGAEIPEQIRADIEQIHATARHLGRLIDDVLDLASSDAQQLRLNFEFVDLAEVLREAEEVGRQLAASKGLTWRASFPEQGPWVWGDRTRLYQVILNLVSNAVKFTSQGEVSLSVTTEAGQARVAVRDTGIGIPPADQPTIFDEFRRSERSILRGYGGIGLGLAVCKRLVTMHGGSIGVHSSGEEGAGSEFFFTLPTVAAPTAAPPEQQPAAEAQQQVLVLSARHAGQQLQHHLSQRGFRVQILPIEDSVAWLGELIRTPYDAVVLDVSQAPEHGWQALRLLKSNPATQEIPTLFYAVHAESGVVMEMNYLAKPFDLTSLSRMLDRYLLGDEEDRERTFLVADDDPHTLDLHVRLIQSQAPSHRVLRARSGKEALEILQSTPVDLVLLDLMMPEIDGFGVLDAMRRDPRTRDIPVIVVTGQVLTEAEMARLNQGVAAVMGKGIFSAEETLAQLEAALSRTRRLSGEAQALVRKAMAYIHTHFARPITRRELAEYVGMSEDYLTYCFRQELGMTPIAYINRYRVHQARRLLLETDKSLTTIALEVGFSSSSYFSRIFRRYTGCTPQAFRRARKATVA